MKQLLFLSFILFAPFVKSMEEGEGTASKLQVYAIPGQNGCGSSKEYLKKLLGNQIKVIPVKNPSSIFRHDLGQTQCMNPFRSVMQNISDNSNSIVHATSQGTATAIRCIAEDKNNKIKGLILESPLVSGNSAIHHTVSSVPSITNLPFSYYWLPYFAKAIFPFYWPAGTQAINVIKNLPTNIPIVIVHSKNDPQLPYPGACALYYGLKKLGNNVYLISKESDLHLEILTGDPDTSLQEQQEELNTNKKILFAILTKHHLIATNEAINNNEEIDLSPYQPDATNFKKYYDTLVFRERVHKCVGYTLGIGTLLICYALIKKIYTYANHKKRISAAL